MALISKIHGRGMKAGVAISPDTPSTAITDEVGNAADMLLVMTVYPGAYLAPASFKLCTAAPVSHFLVPTPGRGGQKFIDRCVPKVAELRARFPEKDIEVDGGVGPKTIGVCADAGAFPLLFSLIFPHKCPNLSVPHTYPVTPASC